MILLYGAGSLGRDFLLNQQEKLNDVIVFTDTDAAKWGTTLGGVPVIEPLERNLVRADHILITTMWTRDIYLKLISQGVRHESIWAPARTLLTPTKELFEPAVSTAVLAILGRLFEDLKTHKISAHVDFGTLLGLWRDASLIRNDTDVDISVLGVTGSEHRAAAEILALLSRQMSVPSQIESSNYHSCVWVEIGERRIPITLDQCAAQPQDQVVQNLQNPHFPPVPLSYITPLLPLPLFPKIRSPNQTPAYLEFRYGKTWQVATSRWAYLYGAHDLDIQVLADVRQLKA